MADGGRVLGIFHGLRVTLTELDGQRIYAFESNHLGAGGYHEAELEGIVAMLREEGKAERLADTIQEVLDAAG